MEHTSRQGLLYVNTLSSSILRPSIKGEPGDFIGINGKSYDPSGLPFAQDAISDYKRKPKKWMTKFLKSVDKHFAKLNLNPPLDKYILDLRHVNKYPDEVQREIFNHINTKYKNYLNKKSKFEIYL